MKNTPPTAAIVMGLFYAIGIGFLVGHKEYGAAAAIFTYGLALALGCIYQAVRTK